MKNPVDSIVSLVREEVLNPRSRDVVLRRYGLKHGRPETLEAIGQSYGITRERVRQIENDVLKIIAKPRNLKALQPFFNDLEEYLKEHGNFRREDKIFEDYGYVCLPVSSANSKSDQAGLQKDFGKCKGAIYLLLNLGEPFQRVGETNEFHSVWTLNKATLKKASAILSKLIKKLDSQSVTVSLDEIIKWLQAEEMLLRPKEIHSFIDASKHVCQNSFGDVGLGHWPEISPRGVKDKAFVIMKKQNRPLHFTEVTELINALLPNGRKAYMQTVHNELIKDPRFVLIGRGVYALTDWGYEPGTVVDVIAGILKKESPLTKNEILEKVKKARLVKDNTVLINLQNKKLFQKLPDGRYALKAA